MQSNTLGPQYFLTYQIQVIFLLEKLFKIILENYFFPKNSHFFIRFKRFKLKVIISNFIYFFQPSQRL